MRLPSQRGPLSRFIVEELAQPPHELPPGPDLDDHPLWGDDYHMALYVCYENHYRGFEEVDASWEWEPSLIAFRRRLEEGFESALQQQVPMRTEVDDVPSRLLEISKADSGPSLARYVETEATLDQVKEFLIHRSIYHLKEADPHSWALPRLAGRPKAALVEIQMDEYGSGVEDRMHATLFRDSLDALDLDSRYGAYLDRVPGITLATVNLMSLFGINRRRRGACMGHLALFEMTSSEPNRRYGKGLRRLGCSTQATRFFDEHVEADSIHEMIAAHDLAGRLAEENDDMAADILFGADALAFLDARFAEHQVTNWRQGRSSLYESHPINAKT